MKDITQTEGIITKTAHLLADKIYDGVTFLLQSKLELLVNVLPETVGIGLIMCGLMMMLGDYQKWMGRAGIVAVGGALLAVIL